MYSVQAFECLVNCCVSHCKKHDIAYPIANFSSSETHSYTDNEFSDWWPVTDMICFGVNLALDKKVVAVDLIEWLVYTFQRSAACDTRLMNVDRGFGPIFVGLYQMSASLMSSSLFFGWCHKNSFCRCSLLSYWTQKWIWNFSHSCIYHFNITLVVLCLLINVISDVF